MKKNLLFYSAFIGSAVMLTVIQPPIGWSALAWVAFVPFILVCSPQAKPRPLALISYIISVCYWLGNLYWVCPVTIVGWAAFCLYTAFLWPILALCLRYCRIKKFPLFLAAPILIVGIERMQGLFLGGFFWRFLAHSQYQNIALIQIADIFGAGGVSFLIGMFNGLLAELILDSRLSIVNRQSSIINIIKAVMVCLTVIAAFAYGQWRIAQSDNFIKAGPIVAALQSNIPQSVKREGASSDLIFNELLQQSKASAQAGAELIIWPETMVQATLDPQVLRILDPSHPYKIFDTTLREHSKDTAFVLVGAYGGAPQIQEDLTIYLAQRFNSAFLYKTDGQQAVEQYNKIHLVPFGEVLPLRKTLPSLYKLLMKVKFIPYNFDYSLDYGSEYTVFEMTSPVKNAPAEKEPSVYEFGVMICYEDTVPAIARRFALDKHGQKQIDWLVNISNDGWFVKFDDTEVSPTAELPQHAAVCAFRAVENRLTIVRSVNTGISCLIDSLGRIRDGFWAGTLPHKAMARTAVAGYFLDRIPIDKRISFFSKNGEWLDFCCEVCLVLLIIVGLSAKFLRTKKCHLSAQGSQMKNTLKKTKLQRNKNVNPFRKEGRFSNGVNVSIFPVFIFVCTMIFSFGCNQPLKTAPRDLNVPDVNEPRLVALRILLEGLADSDPMVRANAIEVVAATRQVKLMPRVQRLARDEFVPVRFAAALAIGDFQYTLGEKSVMQLLKDKDDNVKIAACYAMAKLGAPEYLEVLRKVIVSNNQTVRANAALLLGKSGDRTALKFLYWALQHKDSDDKVVYQAVESIARLGDERIYPKLWSMLISAYADVRIMGIRAMGVMGTAEAKNALTTMLDDELPEVRLAAAEQLGTLKDPAGEPEVRDFFEKNLAANLDQRSRERANMLAALAIGQIRTISLTKFLPELLKNESKFVRIAAAKAVLQSAAKR